MPWAVLPSLVGVESSLWGKLPPWVGRVLSVGSCSRGSSCRGIAGSVPQSGRSRRLQGKTSGDCSCCINVFNGVLQIALTHITIIILCLHRLQFSNGDLSRSDNV